MVACVPSLTGSLYLTDPQSIIGEILRRYFRQPADTIPILSDLIISLPWQVANHGRSPEALCNNIQNDLQNCFNRIFNNERQTTVSVNYTSDETDTYSVTISITYSTVTGDVSQVGSLVSVVNGRLVIPEDNIQLVLRH